MFDIHLLNVILLSRFVLPQTIAFIKWSWNVVCIVYKVSPVPNFKSTCVLCPAFSKSHKMATTLGSALHLQYHALTLEHASSTAGMIVMINVDYLIEPDKTKLDFLRHF